MSDNKKIPIIEENDNIQVRLTYNDDGDVIRQTVSKYDEFGKLIDVTNYYYDENENMHIEKSIIEGTESQVYNKNGDVIEKTTYEYESRGMKIYTTTAYDIDGREISTTKYDHHHSFRFDKSHISHETVTERDYDDKGNEIETRKYTGKNLVEIEIRSFDENDNMIKEEVISDLYGSQTTVNSYDENGEVKEINVKKYDGERNLTVEENTQNISNDLTIRKETIYEKDHENNIGPTKIGYTYENNDLIKTEFYRPGVLGEIEKETTYNDCRITQEISYFQNDEGLNDRMLITTYDKEGNQESSHMEEIETNKEKLTTDHESNEDSITNNEYDKNDIIERKFDENGNEIETKTYYDNELKEIKIREFDENGNMLKEDVLSRSDGSQHTVQSYDENGELKEIDVKNYNGYAELFKEENTQIVNNDMIITKETIYEREHKNDIWPTRTEYTYENGELKETNVKIYKDNGALLKEENTQIVNNDLTITKETIYDKDPKNGIWSARTEYTYENRELIKEEVYKSGKDGEIEKETTYEDGHITQEISYLQDDAGLNDRMLITTYDEDGNVVSTNEEKIETEKEKSSIDNESKEDSVSSGEENDDYEDDVDDDDDYYEHVD